MLLSATDAAEEPVDAQQQQGSQASGVEEIFVTARRREESAQDVPIALSVVDDSALQATGSYSLNEVQRLVPSLQVFSFNPRNTNINIRGLGSNVSLTNGIGFSRTVSASVDDVYWARRTSQFDLVISIRSVLPGPEALFGKTPRPAPSSRPSGPASSAVRS